VVGCCVGEWGVGRDNEREKHNKHESAQRGMGGGDVFGAPVSFIRVHVAWGGGRNTYSILGHCQQHLVVWTH